jgi:DNA polymerase I-like protein with 3'-5' exonuclease and polymerase domains
MDKNTIHLCVTQDIDTGEVRTWKAPNGLAEYLKDATLIIAHNGIFFDFPILNRLWKTQITRKQVFDTLIVSRLLDPTREKGHSLDAWGAELGTVKLNYKAVWTWMENRDEDYDGECFDRPIEPLLVHYCARDVSVLCALFHRLVRDIDSKGFALDSVALEHDVAFVIAQQERNGFKLDVPYATMLLATLKGKMADIDDKMQQRWPPVTIERFSEKTGKRLKDEIVVFNPGSRKQIGEKLQELGWKPKKFTETGQPMVDESILEKLDMPEAKLIAEYLMLQKRIAQIESWMDAVSSDGRVHGRVLTIGAVTNRMAHLSPNMAQVPNAGSPYGPECRQCWTVEEGNVLVGIDASGLELRMLAHYMKDESYVKTVIEGSSKDGTDVHTVNQKAAGLSTRDQAKTFIYAFLYGAGDAKIGSIVGGNAADGKRLKDRFLKASPALSRLRQSVSVYASKGYVPGLDGRKIWVRSEHAALNSLLQSAGAIVMKRALVILESTLRKYNVPFKMVANVHDEWQIETSPEHANRVGIAGVQSIKQAGVFYQMRCPLDGEYKIGNNWKETH